MFNPTEIFGAVFAPYWPSNADMNSFCLSAFMETFLLPLVGNVEKILLL